MSRLRGIGAVTAVLLGALPLLLLLDDAQRVWGFRAYVLVVAMLAGRSIVRWADVSGAMSTAGEGPDPFKRPQPAVELLRAVAARLPLPGRRRVPLSGGATLVHSAMSTAGGVHHRLRPVLQEIAEERLRSRHGIDLDERAEPHVGGHAWALVDPARPAPGDRLGPGLPAADIELALDDLEKL